MNDKSFVTAMKPHSGEVKMIGTKKQKNKMIIEIDTETLNPAQIRLLKSLNAVLTHVMKAEDEAEYFDGSAELMRLCASLIQQSKFPVMLENHGEIAYADQALEFSVDVLQDYIGESNIVTYDN